MRKLEIRKIKRTRRLKNVILLREYREMCGLTQSELGKIIDACIAADQTAKLAKMNE